MTMTPDADLVTAFREGGGAGRPVVGGVKVCRSSNRDRAVGTAHRLWPTELLPGEPARLLPTPAYFGQACEPVTRDTVDQAVTWGDDEGEHIDTVRACPRAGFDEVYVGRIGPDRASFLDAHRELVRPAPR
ncbi:hypothetical protein [Kitasatospora sp. NPDC059571]|uniref:hypothetical protein n=1 Tax=Kitasatospora sp. NPDC059571 TaxID=3346871 RepID=UPI0036C3C830